MNLPDSISIFFDDVIDRAMTQKSQEWAELVMSKKMRLGECDYQIDIWVEKVEVNTLLVIEAKKSKFFVDIVHVRGVLDSSGTKKVLNENEMWDLGFG